MSWHDFPDDLAEPWVAPEGSRIAGTGYRGGRNRARFGPAVGSQPLYQHHGLKPWLAT